MARQSSTPGWRRWRDPTTGKQTNRYLAPSQADNVPRESTHSAREYQNIRTEVITLGKYKTFSSYQRAMSKAAPLYPGINKPALKYMPEVGVPFLNPADNSPAALRRSYPNLPDAFYRTMGDTAWSTQGDVAGTFERWRRLTELGLRKGTLSKEDVNNPNSDFNQLFKTAYRQGWTLNGASTPLLELAGYRTRDFTNPYVISVLIDYGFDATNEGERESAEAAFNPDEPPEYTESDIPQPTDILFGFL